MKAVHPFRIRAPVLGYREPILDSDPFDHQDAVVSFDLPGRLDLVPLRIDLDLTRLQRARKRAGKSATGRRDDVVKRRRVRRILRRVDTVVLRYLGVNPEHDWILLCLEVGQPMRSAEPLDPDSRNVADFAHRLEATPSHKR